ncbi:MAG: hypothetical protein JXB39_11325 [Deltaproteobacteria bacterium]|nr:hypothetical protein [Deltaproteobacteria bacterium]
MTASYSMRQVLVIQGVVGVVALVVGGALGFVVGRAMLERDQRARLGMTPEELLERLQASEKQYAELYGQCEPLQGSERERFIEVQSRVETLRTEIAVREEEITRLEKKAQENVVLKKELEARKQELSQLKVALQEAEAERTELAERLQIAVEETTVARAQTAAARRETVSVRWDEFKASTALTICERGSRSRMEKCREAVLAAMTPEREQQYRECIRREQAVPQLRERQKGEKELPAFAEWVDADGRFTKGWYILFCDPTLPEAPDRAAPAEADTPPAPPEAPASEAVEDVQAP